VALQAQRYRVDGEADVDRAQQTEMARSFRARHRAPPVLLLPNAWDALSARLFVDAGFDALATTSGGVAWALGYPDGEEAPWAEVVAVTARIVRCAQVPVTADIEGGYGATPAEVGAHVAEIVQTGVVGINLEDGLHGPIRSVEDAAAALTRARARCRNGVEVAIAGNLENSVSAACSLSDISGWRDGVLYPLAGGGRGIRRGAFRLRRRDAARPARADGEAAGGAVDFHFSDIPVRSDDGARAIGANDDAAAVELRGRRRRQP
jgi:hypothetical protein